MKASLIAIGILLGVLLSGAAKAEVVTLTLQECLEMGTAVHQQVNSLVQSPAVSFKVQRVVDFIAAMSLEESRNIPEEYRETYLRSREEHIGEVCLLSAMSYGGEVPIELPDEVK